MSVADVWVGLAAVITGLTSLVRQRAPLAAQWRARIVVGADTASLVAASILIGAHPSVLIETPLAPIVALSLGEWAFAVLSLRAAAGLSTPRWLA
jgi:hypothetical protein